MADVREPPPLFEEDLDSKELENDDDIFETDKKAATDTSREILKDEKHDENKFEDVTEELFSESPVLEKELDLPSEIKSHPREPEQSLPEHSVFPPQNQNGSTNDVVSDSPPEPNWSLSDTPKEVSKETKTSDTPKEVFKETKTYDTPKEVSKETKTYDTPKEVSKETKTSDTPKEVSKETKTSDTPKEVSKETKTSDTPKEVSKETKTSDTPKEAFKETKTSVVKSLDDAPRVSVTESSTMYASVSKPPFGFHSMNKKEQPNNEPQEEEIRYNIDITITGTKKVGDGMNAYVVYKVCTKTAIPDFRHTEMEVFRRFSDFLGLRDKLVEKHLHVGVIIPPPPEKSIIGMAKIKVSKEESGSLDFVEQRRAALERFLNRVAQHPVLQTDPNFVDFLELEGDLPKATSTSALSGAGVLRLFSRVGDSIGKITYKMDETDQWFEEKALQIETFDTQLRRLHGNLESLVTSRRELAQNTGILAKSVAILGSSEEHSSLSRALSQLAEVEEQLDKVQEVQADDDFFIFAEFVKDYVGLLQSVKDVFHERIKLYKAWKDNEVALAKKREVKVRMELAHKLDKIQDASREISEWEQHVDKSQQDFERISKNIHKELKRFEQQRCKDFRRIVIAYLESLLNHEQQFRKRLKTFLFVSEDTDPGRERL